MLEEKRLSPAFLFAVFLWLALEYTTQNNLDQSMPIGIAHSRAMKTVLANQHSVTAFTRVCIQAMREIWLLQPALVQKKPQTIRRVLFHPRFKAAYDFLWLRIKQGELPESLRAVVEAKINHY